VFQVKTKGREARCSASEEGGNSGEESKTTIERYRFLEGRKKTASDPKKRLENLEKQTSPGEKSRQTPTHRSDKKGPQEEHWKSGIPIRNGRKVPNSGNKKQSRKGVHWKPRERRQETH